MEYTPEIDAQMRAHIEMTRKQASHAYRPNNPASEPIPNPQPDPVPPELVKVPPAPPEPALVAPKSDQPIDMADFAKSLRNKAKTNR
jgi:hypothetical protein